jgi:predicted nucleotidyltransferase
LASLVKGGILHQRREGKQVYFQAATESPIFEELQGLILKTVGLADVIRDLLRPLAGRIQWAFIYGSIARSEERSASDVDLMIIGQVGLADVSSPLRKAERRINRPVNPTTYTADEFAAKLKSDNHFIGTVLRSKKLFILGDPGEFASTFGQ